jgi:transposase
MNAILYLLRADCPWRYLPRDHFPPRWTLYKIFCKFLRNGVWEAIWAAYGLSEPMGRETSPSLRFLTANQSKSAETTTKWVTSRQACQGPQVRRLVDSEALPMRLGSHQRFREPC